MLFTRRVDGRVVEEKSQMQVYKPTPEVVTPGAARTTVQVRLGGNGSAKILEAPIGTTLESYIRAAGIQTPVPIVAALVNGRLTELTTPVTADMDVLPVTMSHTDGSRVYRRSLSFLLIVAAHELFPKAKLVVDHSMPFGGFYCEIEGRPPLNVDEVAALEKRMREIVAADEPIVKQRMSLERARQVFERQGYDDKLRLLKYRNKDYLTVYKLRDITDYFYGYMVPSTGYLRYFRVRERRPGFVLHFPRRSRPGDLMGYSEAPKLVAVFRQHAEWMRIMDVEDVAALNHAIETDRIPEVILVHEALHEHRIADIAESIAHRRKQVRLVLIAGPSSSGKTTFAKRVAIQLLAQGLRPVSIEMDNYFVDRELTPKDKDGHYDFEALEALNLALFNEHLLKLMEGQAVQLPHYNFKTGRSETGAQLAITPDHILLIEGIHGLNPGLVPQIPPERIFRIYVSALTQLNIDRHNRVPTTDTRLVRRIVRDNATRGYTARDTISRWEAVRAGETRNIFPYQENADVMFNSALVYEHAVLKPLVEPLLRQIRPGSPEYMEADRLLAFLEWFLPCSSEHVPDNSLLREFIGGSTLRNFTV
jgi:uridine kinase